MRPFHVDDFSSLTTLCRRCIRCNVYRIMTSWRKELPRVCIAARLRKAHSSSFNVLSHWLFGQYNCRMRIKKGLRKTSEPTGTCLRFDIGPLDCQRHNPSARTLGTVVAVTQDFYIVEYIMRECRWKLHA